MDQFRGTRVAAAPVAGTRRASTTTRLGALLAGAAVLAAGCGSGGSGSGGPADGADSLVVVVRNHAVPQAPLAWAIAQGYFDNVGLEVRIEVAEAANSAQLVSGQADLFWGTQGALFGIANSGKQVSTVYGTDAGAAGWVVTSDDSIQSPEQCQTVTTATPGTVMYAWTRQLERIYDVQWQITQLTSVPAIAANVVAGRTQCATGNVSYYQAGIDEGRLRVILDPTDKADLPAGWPALGVEDVVAGLPKTLGDKREAVQRFLEAYHTALPEYLETSSSDIATTLLDHDNKWAAVGLPKVLAQAVEDYKPLLSPDDGYVSEETWTETLAFFGEGGLDFLNSDPGRFAYGAAVDMSYYEAAIGR